MLVYGPQDLRGNTKASQLRGYLGNPPGKRRDGEQICCSHIPIAFGSHAGKAMCFEFASVLNRDFIAQIHPRDCLHPAVE